MRLKHNGTIHDIGAELHDSDDDSHMFSDTSYTELQGLVDSDSEPEFVVPDGWVDSDHEVELEFRLHTASYAPGCVSQNGCVSNHELDDDGSSPIHELISHAFEAFASAVSGD